MFDLVLEDGRSYLFSSLFIDKLGRVTPHEDHRLFPRELLLQEFQIRLHMQAIDTAVGPKINERDFAHQVFYRDGRRVEPLMIGGELLCPQLLLLLQRSRLHHPQVVGYTVEINLREDVVV